MKRLILSVVASWVAFSAVAADAASDAALATAEGWLARQKFAPKAAMGEPVRAERRMTQDGQAFYVVSFSRSGYVVVAGEDGIGSVVAFSASARQFTGDSAFSPLGSMLAQDLSVRASAAASGGEIAYKLPKAAGSRESVSDMRVAPLLKSSWGQGFDSGYSNSGNPCYNYYTPNNVPCGCTATAMAQVMRYWEYPRSAPAGKYVCAIEGSSVSLSIGAGDYDWANMPYVTDSQTTTEAQRQAIGKLTYDCAVAMHSWFYSGGTSAYCDFAFCQFVKTFGYANAMGYCPVTKSGIPFEDLRDTMFANFDYGCPVLLSIQTADKLGHQVVADGYGFVNGVAYVHLNVGWNSLSDECDVWYNLPQVTAYVYDFSMIDGMIYNVFPKDTGDILSGRVVDAKGNPVANVVITAKARTGNAAAVTTKTNAQGIYAFLLKGGTTYTVSCGSDSKLVKLTRSVSEETDWTEPLHPYFYVNTAVACGNSWGNDFVYAATTPDPEPGDGPDKPDEPEEPDPGEDDPEEPIDVTLGPFAPTKAYNGVAPYCGAVYDDKGAVYGTISLKIGKLSKKGISKVSGTITLLDGKKYSVKSADFSIGQTGPTKVTGIDVTKLGKLDLTVGNKGFIAELTMTDGSTLKATTSDLSQGLAAGAVTFLVEGMPEEIDGYPILSECSADGQSITVSSKGKLDCGKAAAVKYVKVTEKDPETGKKVFYYELQGLDDPKKPNLSGLKLTYTAKTAMFKGSFYVYTDCGTEAKPKLKKTSVTVAGFVIGGKGYGTATIKKVGTFSVTIAP